MKFERTIKTSFYWSNRRAAAVKRRQAREIEKMGLFAEEMQKALPSVEQERDAIEQCFELNTKHDRDFTAQQWPKARKAFYSLPVAHRLAIKILWDNNKWIPKKAHYFASLVHDWTVKGWRPNRLQTHKYGLQDAPIDYCLISDGTCKASAIPRLTQPAAPQMTLF